MHGYHLVLCWIDVIQVRHVACLRVPPLGCACRAELIAIPLQVPVVLGLSEAMGSLVVLVITQVILEGVAVLLFGQPLDMGCHGLAVVVRLRQERRSLTGFQLCVVLLVLQHARLHQ